MKIKEEKNTTRSINLDTECMSLIISIFTMVELLVIVAIVAVLVSILLPALKTASDKVKQTSCANTLRQIGMAVHMYSSDWNDWMVPVSYDWTNDASQDVLRNGPWPARLLPYLGGENLKLWSTFFICPSVATPRKYREDNRGNVPAGTNAMHSYGLNSTVGDLNRLATMPAAYDTMFRMKKINQIVSFAPQYGSNLCPLVTEVTYPPYDTKDYLSDYLRWDVANYPRSLMVEMTLFPHRGRGNFLFMDGGTDSITPSNALGWHVAKYRIGSTY